MSTPPLGLAQLQAAMICRSNCLCDKKGNLISASRIIWQHCFQFKFFIFQDTLQFNITYLSRMTTTASKQPTSSMPMKGSNTTASMNLGTSKPMNMSTNSSDPSMSSTTSKQPMKDYYAILGVSENASLFDIESAYEKLAARWHPDKHREHRKSAETMFHDISEAYECLSDRNKRCDYDEIRKREYSMNDATCTFERFFNENPTMDTEEQKFLNENYPNPMNSYYCTLGVPKTATMEEIKTAYRKLAIRYHPKTNPNDEEAHAKFIAVNEAYKVLSNEMKRQNYDSLIFGQMMPVKAHSIFDDFFGNRLAVLDDEDFKPMFRNKWSRDLDSMMVDEYDQKTMKDGSVIKSSTVCTNTNGKETKKTVTTKKTIKDGKCNSETTEDYLFPNGERSVTKTIDMDGKVETKKYCLKKGEAMPKELCM